MALFPYVTRSSGRSRGGKVLTPEERAAQRRRIRLLGWLVFYEWWPVMVFVLSVSAAFVVLWELPKDSWCFQWERCLKVWRVR